jgi:hypothetical protein
MYRAIGFAHASMYHELHKAHRTLVARDEGQGTVEYIGLILLLAAVMAVVSTSANGKSIGGRIVGEITKAIDSVSATK